MLLHMCRRDGTPPPFDVLRAMMFYVDEFPERLHHTKESELLFPKLRERCPELADTLARLDEDHGRGEAAILQLEHLMLAYEVMGESRRQAFEDAVTKYIDSYLRHTMIEETEILPAARAQTSVGVSIGTTCRLRFSRSKSVTSSRSVKSTSPVSTAVTRLERSVSWISLPTPRGCCRIWSNTAGVRM